MLTVVSDEPSVSILRVEVSEDGRWTGYAGRMTARGEGEERGDGANRRKRREEMEPTGRREERRWSHPEALRTATAKDTGSPAEVQALSCCCKQPEHTACPQKGPSLVHAECQWKAALTCARSRRAVGIAVGIVRGSVHLNRRRSSGKNINFVFRCVISGFRRDVNEIFLLLGCYAE